MIARTLFSEAHEQFRKGFRRFLDTEVAPRHAAWEDQKFVDPDIWRRAGELGFLCVTVPEEYGGAGVDRRFSVILMEEQTAAGLSGPGWGLHSDIVANYLVHFGTPEQRQAFLPKMVRGEMITAIAMTEPDAGSDLQAMKTVAVEDGDSYLLKGSKIFITNGFTSDLVVVAAKTGPVGGGAKDVTLFLVEATRPGFTKGKPLRKIGMHAQDTCELFFDNVRVPKANVLGPVGGGFVILMKELAWERLIIAITAVAGCEHVLKHTIAYTKERKAFGKTIASFQNTRFKLAEMTAQTQIARVYVDRCIELAVSGDLSPAAAASAKYWCTELQGTVNDECVQLHGGYGYMLDYPVARAFVDSRAQRIYGGSNEIMKELIARTL